MNKLPPIHASELTRSARNSENFKLSVLQQPRDSKASNKPEKCKFDLDPNHSNTNISLARGAKWPIDPPPVVELVLNDKDQNRTFLSSPFWFCAAELEPLTQVQSTPGLILVTGSLASSLHKVKLQDNRERGLFIFGDMNARVPGQYRIRFTLYEMRLGRTGMYAERLAWIHSDPIQIVPPKTSLPPRDSTQLSRSLCEAGIKLRIRKESARRRSQPLAWTADAAIHGAQFIMNGGFMNGAHQTLPMSMPMLQPYAMSQPGEMIGQHRFTPTFGSNLGIRHHMDSPYDFDGVRIPPIRYAMMEGQEPPHNGHLPAWNGQAGTSAPLFPPSTQTMLPTKPEYMQQWPMIQHNPFQPQTNEWNGHVGFSGYSSAEGMNNLPAVTDAQFTQLPAMSQAPANQMMYAPQPHSNVNSPEAQDLRQPRFSPNLNFRNHPPNHEQ